MHNLRSTFPLDEAAITRAALGKIVVDPITWVPFVPVVAAYTIFDVPGLIALPLGVVVLGGVGAFWRKQWSGLREGLRRQMIEQHNVAQNALLHAGADELRSAGAVQDAKLLEKFIAVKALVEQRLHEDGTITGQKIQLEQLVDSLCFGVRDQLNAMVHREEKAQSANRKAVLAQVTTAYETLKSTVAELDVILGPTEAGSDPTSPSLEEVTRRLREEAEIARRVQARLHQAESGPASAPSAQITSE